MKYLLISSLIFLGCQTQKSEPKTENSILIVTWDTVRWDATGLAGQPTTPFLDRFSQTAFVPKRAYSPIPLTGPAHAVLFSGKSPADLGVYENGRVIPKTQLVSEAFQLKGYSTAGFVSAFPLSAKFGFSRGFDTYDQPLTAERTAKETVDQALNWLAASSGPAFVWVHLYDAHLPYVHHPEMGIEDPYRSEIAFMDFHTKRLVEAFDQRFPESIVIIAADHGEGLGQHGEEEHGTLLFEEALRIPIAVRAPKLNAVDNGILSLADLGQWLLADDFQQIEVSNHRFLAYSAQPFLNYGWAPQMVALEDQNKWYGDTYWTLTDLAQDPKEEEPKRPEKTPDWVDFAMESWRESLNALQQEPLSEEDQATLASLGYTSSGGLALNGDLPSPRDKVHLLNIMDEASHAFNANDYETAEKLYRDLVSQDPQNPSIPLRLGVIATHKNEFQKADDMFKAAAERLQNSADLSYFWGLSYAKRGDTVQAENLFQLAVKSDPNRAGAWMQLATLYRKTRQSDPERTALQSWLAIEPNQPQAQERLGHLSMQALQTSEAIEAFEQSMRLAPDAFRSHLELGACYQSIGQLHEAAQQFARVPSNHPGFAMATLKRAEIAFMLQDPQRESLARQAWQVANPMTRPMLENHPILRNFKP